MRYETAITKGPQLLVHLSGFVVRICVYEHLVAQSLGLFRQPPHKAGGVGDEVVEKLMPLMVEIRSKARESKDFATADRVRQELARLGITLEDRKDATGWRIAPDDAVALLGGVMELLIELRSQARKNKNFTMADQIRAQVTAAGITLEDRKGETGWRVD